jgi:hypothetical protein
MWSRPSMRSLTLAPSAFLLLLLTACATSTEAVSPSLPAAPAGLAACAAAPVPAIPGARGTAITKAQASEALADQRAEALAKDRCARGWASFYGDLETNLK